MFPIGTSTRMIACSAVLAAALSMSACTSGKHATPASGQQSTTAATRWWSNSAVTAGSTVDPGSSDAAVARLQPSRTDYCAMLRATLASNRVLSSLGTKDAALAASAKAFVAEIEKVAPANVSAAWQLLGPVILGVVSSGSTSSALNNAQNLQAAQVIASDAKSSCNVDLSKVITGSATGK